MSDDVVKLSIEPDPAGLDKLENAVEAVENKINSRKGKKPNEAEEMFRKMAKNYNEAVSKGQATIVKNLEEQLKRLASFIVGVSGAASSAVSNAARRASPSGGGSGGMGVPPSGGGGSGGGGNYNPWTTATGGGRGGNPPGNPWTTATGSPPTATGGGRGGVGGGGGGSGSPPPRNPWTTATGGYSPNPWGGSPWTSAIQATAFAPPPPVQPPPPPVLTQAERDRQRQEAAQMQRLARFVERRQREAHRQQQMRNMAYGAAVGLNIVGGYNMARGGAHQAFQGAMFGNASGVISGGLGMAGGAASMLAGPVGGPIIRTITTVLQRFTTLMDEMTHNLAKYNSGIANAQAQYEVAQIQFNIRMARASEGLLVSWNRAKIRVLESLERAMPAIERTMNAIAPIIDAAPGFLEKGYKGAQGAIFDMPSGIFGPNLGRLLDKMFGPQVSASVGIPAGLEMRAFSDQVMNAMRTRTGGVTARGDFGDFGRSAPFLGPGGHGGGGHFPFHTPAHPHGHHHQPPPPQRTPHFTGPGLDIHQTVQMNFEASIAGEREVWESISQARERLIEAVRLAGLEHSMARAFVFAPAPTFTL